MRIGIDARFLGPEGTGLGRYVQELISNLEILDEKNEYVIFLRKQNFDLYQPRNKNFKKVLADARWYGLKEQIILPFIFSSQKLDLLHIPHFNIPVFYPGKIVVTIHDLIKSEFAGLSATTRMPFVYLLKHLGYEAVVRIAVRRARKILVPSNSIAKKLRENFRVPEGKIAVTHEAASLTNSKFNPPTGGQNSKIILDKYKIKKPYLIYVGNAYPYKNLDCLLAALTKLPGTLSFINPCSRSTFYDRLKERARELGLGERVILPGYVPDEDLAGLYKEAEAYVFPSLSEGFGIPGLDAMVLGTPVVCSDIPTLKEIYGDAALYFDPHSEDDMAEKIKKILQDQKLRQDLIEKGKKQVQIYSWHKMAETTLATYQSS
jgi:glycosyltransferase involved in cell wall biosynthesis